MLRQLVLTHKRPHIVRKVGIIEVHARIEEVARDDPDHATMTLLDLDRGTDKLKIDE